LIKSDREDSFRGERRFVVSIDHNSTEAASITHAPLQKQHDYQLWPESAPADASLLVESLERVVVGPKKKMGAVGGDRGFASNANSVGLAEAEIFDSLCPRSPAALKERMKEPRFVRMQKRRSQTEGRISILQRGFLGRPMRAKGFAHRELPVAWGVLTHNLWMLARLKREKKEPLRQAA
jgi:hypothetical protein